MLIFLFDILNLHFFTFSLPTSSKKQIHPHNFQFQPPQFSLTIHLNKQNKQNKTNNKIPNHDKPAMFINNNHHRHHNHRRSCSNNAVERLNPHRDSSENESPNSDKLSSAQSSPEARSQWSYRECIDSYPYTGLLASLVRVEGNVYSLAASKGMLYTGSDSKNIHVWKNRKQFTGFKSNSGLVKAIVISDNKIFTGHRDGKIRVWNASVKNASVYKKIGTLPNLTSIMKKSIKPKNYTEVWRKHRQIWIKHFDVVSSLNLSEDHTLLYSASWDQTIKVWNVSNFKCLESIPAHEDAVNAVVSGFDGYVFSGSADGEVKVWKREKPGKRTKHALVDTLLNQDCAVTSLVVNPSGTVIYAGLSDGFLHYWERDELFSGGRVLKCHKLAVLCLAVAGSMVFSGSADADIGVWRREECGEHKCVYVLRGHGGPVKCLAVDVEEGGYWTLYSGSLDRSVKIWRVSKEKEEEEEEVKKKEEDRWRWSCNGGFQRFTEEGRLVQRRK